MYRAESKAMLAEKGVARVRQDGSKESELARMAREMEEEEDEDEEDRQAVALLDDVERHEGDNPGNMNMELCNNTTSNQNDEHDNDTTGNGEANHGNMNMNNENHENDNKNTRDVEKGRQSQTATQQQQQSRQSYFPHENTISDDDDDDDSSAFSSATDLKNKQDLAQILDEERHMPMGNIQVLTVTFAVILFINLLKGGGAFQSPLGIQCGSPSFWMANGIMLAWILLVSVFARSYLVRRYEIKERVGYPYVEGDIKWDPRATIVYPVICTAAGFFAGMFGVGGGIVKGPLMLAMGVHPKVSSASSACMILFTSFTATTSFVVFGLLDMEYAAICLTLGFVATLVGQIGLFYLMERFQRNSYIAFSIGGIVLLSAFLMTIQSLLSMAEKGGPKPPSGLCTGKQ